MDIDEKTREKKWIDGKREKKIIRVLFKMSSTILL